MKIAFVLPYYIPHIGGAEIVFKNLINRLLRRGHKCTVITSRLPKTKKHEKHKNLEIHRMELPSFIDKRYWFDLLSLPTILKIVKDHDIIHTTTFNGALPSIMASKILSIPCIITVHEIFGDLWDEVDVNFFASKIYKYFERYVLSLDFDYYVCVSKSTKRNLEKYTDVTKSKIKVIYNGMDYDLFNPKKYKPKKIRKKLKLEKNFVYMYSGRPGVTKGVEYLIRAVPEISELIPNSKLLLILDDDPKGRYNMIIKLIDELKIRNKIVLLKPIPFKELPVYTMASDCFVIPSISEGFGFNVTNTCALKVPVVASNTTSIPEVVSGKHVLVRPRDPHSIAKGCEMVYKKKYKFKKHKRFDWNRTVKEYEKVYKKFLR